MIGRLCGQVVEEYPEGLVVDVNGIGYEVNIPPYQLQVLRARHLPADDPKARLEGMEAPVTLYIHHHVPERKPVPVLFGFNDAHERQFFVLLAGVSRFGPMAATKSMVISVPDYASRIMTRDIKGLTALPGIGSGKAEQVIASLRSKMALFAMMPEEKLPERVLPPDDEVALQAQIALENLGYKPIEADALIRRARETRPDAQSLELLLDAVWSLSREKS